LKKKKRKKKEEGTKASTDYRDYGITGWKKQEMGR
jgi:hypothetical protein